MVIILSAGMVVGAICLYMSVENGRLVVNNRRAAKAYGDSVDRMYFESISEDNSPEVRSDYRAMYLCYLDRFESARVKRRKAETALTVYSVIAVIAIVTVAWLVWS